MNHSRALNVRGRSREYLKLTQLKGMRDLYQGMMSTDGWLRTPLNTIEALSKGVSIYWESSIDPSQNDSLRGSSWEEDSLDHLNWFIGSVFPFIERSDSLKGSDLIHLTLTREWLNWIWLRAQSIPLLRVPYSLLRVPFIQSGLESWASMNSESIELVEASI